MASTPRLLKDARNSLGIVSWRNMGVLSVTLMALLATFYLVWTFESDVETSYGRRREGKSVNGTGVLAGVFERSGHSVVSRKSLSPAIERAQTVVWMPDDYAPPTKLQSDFLENWLTGQPERTLIYVGRDFDAGPVYWKQIERQVEPALLMETRRRWAKAQAAHDYDRASAADKAEAQWFTSQCSVVQRRVEALEGPWSEGLVLERMSVVMGHNMIPELSGEKYVVEPLLSADNRPFVTRLQHPAWQDSQVILISNGSFLLNLPLVNSEHRKLAGRLVSHCKRGLCVFLETGLGGPRIANQESRKPGLTGFEVLTVWPIGPIVIHLVVLGMLACFLLFPIFGNPRTLAQDNASDFGEHVQALGELLYRVNDKAHARRQINAYRKVVRGEAESEFQLVGESALGKAEENQSDHTTPNNSNSLSTPATTELILEYAQQAVQAARRAGYQLDFSIESLQIVDKMIREVRDSQKSISAVSNQVFQLGCYAGETMRLFHGGDWHHPDESDLYRMISPYMVITLSPSPGEETVRPQILNPIGKALNMLDNDPEGTLVHYHELVRRSGPSESDNS